MIFAPSSCYMALNLHFYINSLIVKPFLSADSILFWLLAGYVS